jgi:hypothetical protein
MMPIFCDNALLVVKGPPRTRQFACLEERQNQNIRKEGSEALSLIARMCRNPNKSKSDWIPLNLSPNFVSFDPRPQRTIMAGIKNARNILSNRPFRIVNCRLRCIRRRLGYVR